MFLKTKLLKLIFSSVNAYKDFPFFPFFIGVRVGVGVAVRAGCGERSRNDRP